MPSPAPRVVAVAGARSLPARFAPAVQRVAVALSGAGFELAVGCCVGVDELVLSSAPAPSLRVFAQFSRSGAGACRLSAVAAVQSAAASGAVVSWSAGGCAAAPLRSRLAARTRAVVRAADAAAVVIFARAASRGSLLAAKCAAARGLVVWAVCCGFAPSALPPLAAGGAWVCSGGDLVRWLPKS